MTTFDKPTTFFSSSFRASDFSMAIQTGQPSLDNILRENFTSMFALRDTDEFQEIWKIVS